jgi:hypothetical protein
VFINYRTGDGEWAAALLDEALKHRFGADQVFYASRSIEPGSDFAEEIRRRLVHSDVLLAVIGKRWLGTDGNGRRRIDKPDDWVRQEIRLAFEHRVRVIPVLLDEAPLLPKTGIPDDIAALARCQYLRLRHRDRDGHDVLTLVNELTRLLPPRAVEPWRVRIHDERGAVRGAGVLLSDEHVLTAAHVVSGEVTVEPIGLTGAPRTPARVVSAGWAPGRGDKPRHGDVALLRLAHPLPSRVGATLRRTALSWERHVRVCGFPPGQESGVYTRAILLGPDDANGEWLPMSASRPGEHRIGTGFAGAGVVDEDAGHLLGIVVGEYEGGLAWMIPVETVLSHLPAVAEWVTGDGVADKVFSSTQTEPGAPGGDLVRSIADWTDRRDSGDRVMIIVGPEVAEVYRAVGLSDRERRTEVVDPARDSAPAVGSIDLAVDASGRTADEVARRVLDRAGIPLDTTKRPSDQLRDRVPPMTIVVDGVDRAEQPVALLNEVLRPLAEGDSRLILGFGEMSSPSLDLARSWDFGSVDYRLTRLAERTDQLVAAELRVVSLRRHVYDPAPVSDHAVRLPAALGALRQLAAEPDPDATRDRLERFERKVARALRSARQLETRLLESLWEREVLRGRVEAYKAKANDEGLVEDEETAALYRRAHELLWRAPTDVAAARQAVRDYLTAIRQALGAGRREDGDDPL